MTEPTNTMNTITYANQILLDYLACDDELDVTSHQNNQFIIEFNNRMDALYTPNFILTQYMLEYNHINLENEDDRKAYDEYVYYEEYYWEFIMDRPPQPMFGDDDDDDDVITRVNVDISSVYELMLAHPANEAAAAA